jgi:hypothetical protein
MALVFFFRRNLRRFMFQEVHVRTRLEDAVGSIQVAKTWKVRHRHSYLLRIHETEFIFLDGSVFGCAAQIFRNACRRVRPYTCLYPVSVYLH